MKLIRLVIVEDSEDDTLLILRELGKGGYRVEHTRVEDADAFNAAMAEKILDLVIADHSLPAFSAPEALQGLQRSGRDLPFIIVSSTIGEEAAVDAMKAGAQDYIMKDNLVRLVPVVERVLQEAAVRVERRKAEEALLESEERFRRLADNARDLIFRFVFIPKRHFEYVSPSISEFTGYSPEEHYADPGLIYRIVHPEDRKLIDEYPAAAAAETQPVVMRWIHRSGHLVWTEQRNVPIYNEQKEMVALEGIARDITERVIREQQLKTSHAQIEALSNRILGAMEEERARLARELHDELGQALTALKLDLQMLGNERPAGEGEKDRLEQSIALVDRTIDIVRRQSVSLRPPALDDMGLVPAIEDMVRGFINRTGIETVLSANGFSRRLPGPVETALYRCVQESLTNVARHARARKVKIELSRQNDLLAIKIVDDGVGFEPEKISVSAEHIGLTGMQERVKLLAGQFRIQSAPGRGTKIKITVPWSEAPPGGEES